MNVEKSAATPELHDLIERLVELVFIPPFETDDGPAKILAGIEHMQTVLPDGRQVELLIEVDLEDPVIAS